MRKNILYLILCFVLMGLVSLGLVNLSTRRFDASRFDAQTVIKHVGELSSAQYQGRLAGSAGNELALKYIENYFKQIGIEPAGDDRTYYQRFKSMVPVYNTQPYFRITDQQGRVVGDYVLGSDYFEVLSGYGGVGDVTANLFIPEKNITSYSQAELKGKVVLVPGLQAKEADYAIDQGVVGIITSQAVPKRVPVPLEARNGKTVLMLSLGAEKFAALRAEGQNQLKAQIHLDIPYKLLDTPNILGKITGKKADEVVIFAARVDGLGAIPNGQYFPGAIDGASGVATMLELAKAIKQQNVVPEKTIVFAAWNNEEFGQKGSTYYSEHPIFPLENTSVIQLNALGGRDCDELRFSAAGQLGSAFAGKIKLYADDSGFKSKISGDFSSSFVDKNVPTTLVTSSTWDNNWVGNEVLTKLGSVQENADLLDVNNVRTVGLTLLHYARIEIIGDYFPDYVTGWEMALTAAYLLCLGVIYLLIRLYKTNGGLRLLRWSLSDIYFSVPFNLLLRVYYFITPVIFIFLSLVIISNIPIDFNLITVGKRSISNASWYLVIKHSVMYIKELFTVGLGASKYRVHVMDALPTAFFKSAVLLLLALLFAFIVGIAKGIRDGYRMKQSRGFGIVGTIAGLSIPDVLIVIVSQLTLIYISRYNPVAGVVRSDLVSKFLLPLFCLTVLPAMYISRIVATVVQAEIQKDYIQVARAKGLSDYRIILNHLLIVTVLKVIDSLSSVLTMMISNLIVVEYLCYYPGIVFGLMFYYKQNDPVPFIGFAMGLGLFYLAFNLLFQGLAKLVNPLKREGVY